MRPMRRRFHLFHAYSAFGFGGVPLRMSRVINYFGDRYRHTILSMNGNVDCRARIDERVAVDVVSVRASSHNFLRNVARFRLLLGQLRPDLVLTFNFGALEWALAESLRRAPANIHFESGFSAEEAHRQLRRRVWFRRLALMRTPTMVVPSRTLERLATEVWGFNAGRVQRIAEGIDTERFAVPAAVGSDAKNRLVVGSVAPLRPVKNLGALVRAFACLGDRPEAKLLIVGGGPELPKLRKLANELGVAARTEFTGHVDNVAAQLARMDVFVLSSLSEQMPTALLQAMAAGRAVVAYDVGDVRIMLPDANRPNIVKAGDEAGLAARIQLLLDRPDIRSAASQANAAVARNFDEQVMFDAYDRLFAQALRQSPVSRRLENEPVPSHL